MAEPVIIEFVPAPVVEVLFPDAVKGDPGLDGASSWDSVTGKPAEFPPEDHTHVIADTTGLQAALDGKSATAHTHVIADTTGLQAALDGKAGTSHTHAIADTTGLQGVLDAKVGSEIIEEIFSRRNISYTDFGWFSGVLGFNVVPFGGGTLTQVNVSGHSGAAACSINTTIGSIAGIGTGRISSVQLLNDIQLGVGKSIAGGLLQISATLSTGGNPYAVLIGFVDVATSVTNGVYFRYDQSQSVWQAICRAGGVQTAVNTDITVAVSTTYRWRIEINAAGNQALFYIDGVLKATIVTNIPNGPGNRATGLAAIVRPSSGSQTSTVNLMRAYWIIED